MDRKTIQKRRMMSYFIDATNQIIEKDGLENVTIRNVAKLAGYHNATLYNYFENLEHLVLFASMKYLREYTKALPSYVEKACNPHDKYFLIWECFCKYSFENPKIYKLIFFSEFSHSLNEIIKEYYSIFTDELSSSEDLNFMLLGNSIYSRSLSILEKYMIDLNLSKDELDKINEMTILIYEGMLRKLLTNNPIYSIDESINKTMCYIKEILTPYIT